jgi:hypothetical protein
MSILILEALGVRNLVNGIVACGSETNGMWKVGSRCIDWTEGLLFNNDHCFLINDCWLAELNSPDVGTDRNWTPLRLLVELLYLSSLVLHMGATDCSPVLH